MKQLIIGASILLMSMSQSAPKPKLYIIGDSTASIYASSLYPRTGWAQILQDYFITDSVQIVDKASSGRSSKSFYDEGQWTPVKNALSKGDYVIIQFGHNDEKTEDATRGTLPGSTFKQYLSIYVDDAIAKCAIPILATPVMRNSWSSSTTVNNTHVTAAGDYPQAVRDLAAAKKIGLIDATALTKTFFEKIGKDSTTRLFLNLAAGESPNYPSGNSDNTHLKESGARAVAQLIVNDAAGQKIQPLSSWIKGGATPVAQPSLPGCNQMTQHQTALLFYRTGGNVSLIFDCKGRSLALGHIPASGNLLLHGTATGKRVVTKKVNVQ